MKQRLSEVIHEFERKLLIIAVWLVSSSLVVAQGIAPEGRAKFRESVTLDLNSQVIKNLATAQDHVAEQRWAQAVPLLQQLIEEQGDELVPVEFGRYSNAADVCHEIVSRFPNEALKLYRDRVDPVAKSLFEAGQKELDELQLRRVVQIGFNSSYGDDALWMLGDLAFERGEFALARSYWEQLIPEQPRTDQPASKPVNVTIDLTYPTPDFSAAEVASRLVLCSIFDGNFDLADLELAAFRKLYPKAKGHLAGVDGDLAEILSHSRLSASQWSLQTASAGDWPTLGGNDARSRVSSKPVESLGLRWSTVLPSNPYVGRSPRIALHERPPLSFFPVVTDGAVFVCGPDSVHAIDLISGGPKWPTQDKEPSRIFTNVGETAVRPTLETVGVPYYSMTIDHGRLFTRLGPPVVRRSRNEAHTVSEIFGFDLRAEGRLIFQQASSVLDGPDVSPEATAWSFEGTPVVEGNRLWVSARRGFPEEEVEVVCFDVETRQLVWRRRLCAVLRNSPEHFNVIGHRLLTLSDGRIILETSSGAIASLDAETGKIIWLVTYETLPREDLPLELNDSRRSGLTPCVAAEGLIFAAPSDSQSVFAFDTTTGRIVWQYRMGDRVQHLLGVSDGRLIVSGRQLWALSIRNGRPTWPEQKVGSDDPRGHGYGRGVLTEGSIYWPLHEEIWRVDVKTGALQARYAIQEAIGETGGNLVVANGLLLIAQAQRLVALGEPIEVLPPPEPKTGASRTKRQRDDLFTPLGKATQNIPQKLAAAIPASNPSWPVKRDWTMPLNTSDQVLVASNSASVRQTENSSVPVLIQSADALQAVNAVTGQVEWRGNSAELVTWLAHNESRLLLGHARQLSARDARSGRHFWTTRLQTGSNEQSFEYQLLVSNADSKTSAPGVVLCRTDARLIAIDVATGRTMWQISASENRLECTNSHSLFDLSERCLLFRPLREERAARLDLLTGEPRNAISIPAACQQMLVVPFDETSDRLLTLTCDHKLVSWTMDGAKIWSYPDRISVSFHQPQLRKSGRVAILIEDGLFARRIDLNSGKALWSQPLAKTPLANLDDLKLTRDGLVCLGSGILKRIRLTDGEVSWRHYLGQEEWRLEPRSSCDSSAVVIHAGNESTRIMACEESTGDFIQSLTLPATKRARPLYGDDDRWFFASHDTLIGLTPLP